MRIYDAHTHIGDHDMWHCRLDELLHYMDDNGVEKAVVGHMDGNVLGARSFGRLLRETEGYEDRLRLMLWVNPGADDLSLAEDALERYADRIACIKAHPNTARIRVDSGAYVPYAELCRRYRLPFACHTEKDGYSDIDSLEKLALAFPEVPFVAIHMELRNDHTRAIERISETGNLYGDLTFVPVKVVAEAVRVCGADKLLFGTDAPIMTGRFPRVIEELKGCMSEENAEKVFFGNCARLFRMDS